MAAPFEDEVIKFIGTRRPLKLAFLLVAAIGVLGSAYKTVEPVLEKVKPFVFRVLDLELERAVRQKYGCAYFSGGAQWNLPAAARVASSLTTEVVIKNLSSYQMRLATCLNALGYSTPTNWTPTSDQSKELDRAHGATIGALNSFTGSLQAKDRLTYLIYQIGNDVAFVLTQFEPSSPEERLTLSTALAPYEADVSKRLSASLDEARALCPCKLPAMPAKLEDRRALLEAARAIDESMLRLLPNEA